MQMKNGQYKGSSDRSVGLFQVCGNTSLFHWTLYIFLFICLFACLFVNLCSVVENGWISQVWCICEFVSNKLLKASKEEMSLVLCLEILSCNCGNAYTHLKQWAKFPWNFTGICRIYVTVATTQIHAWGGGVMDIVGWQIVAGMKLRKYHEALPPVSFFYMAP